MNKRQQRALKQLQQEIQTAQELEHKDATRESSEDEDTTQTKNSQEQMIPNQTNILTSHSAITVINTSTLISWISIRTDAPNAANLLETFKMMPNENINSNISGGHQPTLPQKHIISKPPTRQHIDRPCTRT
jgi:ABC-type lipoprotein export system ATPase subunit